MNQAANTPTHSHPDVQDALKAFQGLMALAMRRAGIVYGKPREDELRAAFESGSASMLFTIEVHAYTAKVCAAAKTGEEYEPLLNLDIDALIPTSDANGKGSRH